jgi:hypothetical protein
MKRDDFAVDIPWNPENPFAELDRDMRSTWRRSVVRFLQWTAITLAGLVLAFFIIAMILICCTGVRAHDRDGHWAKLAQEGKAPPKEWWDHLASGKGLCCSFADGETVKDVDWDTEGPNGGYRVFLDGHWIDVPPEAVINEPNRFGPAVVWPYRSTENIPSMMGGIAELKIRCFLPGAGA